MLTQPIQPGPHHLHGDAVIVAVGHVEDVAGDQLDGLDLAHGTDRRPAVAPMSPNTPLGAIEMSNAWTKRRISSVETARVRHRGVVTD